MYIDIDSCGFVSLMQMNAEESEALGWNFTADGEMKFVNKDQNT